MNKYDDNSYSDNNNNRELGTQSHPDVVLLFSLRTSCVVLKKT